MEGGWLVGNGGELLAGTGGGGAGGLASTGCGGGGHLPSRLIIFFSLCSTRGSNSDRTVTTLRY